MTPTTITTKALKSPWEALQAYKLHKNVRKKLPEISRKFLLAKTLPYFCQLTLKRNGALFGVYKDGKIKGIVAVVKCPDVLTAQKKGVLTSPVTPAAPGSPVFVVQALSVLPSECGQKLSCYLLDAAVNYAKANKGAHVFAQMSEGNAASIKQFKKLGFEEVHKWHAPHPKLLLHLKL